MSAAKLDTPPVLRAKHLAPRVVQERGPVVECETVQEGDARAVELLNKVLTKHRASNIELAEILGCDEKVVRLVRAKHIRKPFKCGLLLKLPPKIALEILDLLRLDILRALHGE